MNTLCQYSASYFVKLMLSDGEILARHERRGLGAERMPVIYHTASIVKCYAQVERILS